MSRLGLKPRRFNGRRFVPVPLAHKTKAEAAKLADGMRKTGLYYVRVVKATNKEAKGRWIVYHADKRKRR